MTALLPDIVRDAIQSRSLYSASESFGIVALVLLVLLLLELEAWRVTDRPRDQWVALGVLAQPLLLAVVSTIVLRVTELRL